MEKKILLSYQGAPVGWIDIKLVESRLTLHAECRLDTQGIVRAYACSALKPEMRLLVGVLEPQGGVLQGEKVYTRNQLKCLNVYPEEIDAGELVCDCMSGAKWQPCLSAGSVFSDPALSSSLAGAQGVLSSGELIAAPYDEGKPFALAPAFCIVNIIEINSRKYGVLRRGRDGMPGRIEKM